MSLFSVYYPNTQMIVNVSGTTSTNSTINSSSLIITDGSTYTTKVNSTIVGVTDSAVGGKAGYFQYDTTQNADPVAVLNNGTNLLSITPNSINFSNNNATTSLSCSDGITISTSKFKPSSLIDVLNVSGSPGQFLSPGTGGQVKWDTPNYPFVGTATSNLSMTTFKIIDIGNTSGAPNQILTSGTGGQVKWSNPLFAGTATTNLNMSTFKIIDISNTSGSIGQFLSAGTGGQVKWDIPVSTFVGTATSNLSLTTFKIIDRLNLSGSNGQFLSSGVGGQVKWDNVPFGGTVTADINMSTFKLKDSLTRPGDSGQVLSAGTNGVLLWQNPPFVGTATSNLSMGDYQIADASRRFGSNGQVLTAQNGSMYWSPPAFVGTADSNLSMTTFKIIDIANTSGSNGQFLSAGTGGEVKWNTPVNTFVGTATSNLSMGNKLIIDYTESYGNEGQYLTTLHEYGMTTLRWKDVPSNTSTWSNFNAISNVNMATYNISWGAGLSIKDNGSGFVQINSTIDTTVGRSFQNAYLPVNVMLNGTSTTAYVQLYI